jgi:hypothetical protein
VLRDELECLCHGGVGQKYCHALGCYYSIFNALCCWKLEVADNNLLHMGAASGSLPVLDGIAMLSRQFALAGHRM